LALSSAIVFGLSNVMYKLGLAHMEVVSVPRALSGRLILELLSSRTFVTAIVLTGLAGALYILAISRGEVTVVVATLSVSYLVTALMAWHILGEQLTFVRILGLAMIMAGVAAVNLA